MQNAVIILATLGCLESYLKILIPSLNINFFGFVINIREMINKKKLTNEKKLRIKNLQKNYW